MSRKSSRNNGKNNSVKILPISITIFLILSILALFIILNKGKIGGYSLVKIQTSSDSQEQTPEPEKEEDKMELSVESKYLSYKSKEKMPITVMINGEEIDSSEVEFTSSNEDAIVVEDGVAKAVKDGNSKITATKDDLEATIDLHSIVPIKSISFTATNSVIRVGKSLQMKLIAQPSDANIDTLKYTSSDEEIATVNSNGIVTGVAPGNVTITVTDRYSGLEKSVKLSIRK